ncbi:MAG TPA: SPOR domain-containing protein [Rhizomicrobium sp.]|nr:SPOR domain-containing protein [Rhizomicrobium sp.]
MHLPYRFLTGILAAAVVLAGLSLPAAAKHRRHTAATHVTRSAAHRHPAMRMLASPTDPDKDAALIVDGATGKVLYARNEMAERHPASLTKMMTLYMLFEALRAGKVTMQTPLPVSYHASIQKPTKLNLRPGETIPVDTAIRAIVIRSANDVAVVIAEALGGTESHFGEMMTARARQLGMRETNFHNASGLPDPLQITTASDLAVLARHLAYDFPQYFSYFGLTGFTYKGNWYPTHDNLIGRYDGADGIKTGYTGASGFNLVSSVTRGTTHLIGVVMGGRTAIRRDQEMMRLLDQTYARINANPTLVARATVPWRQVAQATPPAIAGFSLPLAGQQYASVSPVPQTEDEDAAEEARAPDEKALPSEPLPAKLAPVAAAPSPAKPQPAVAAVPATSVAAAKPTPHARIAANAPRPQVRPAATDSEGDMENPTPTPGHNWTIQIGAYADKALADAQLRNYAEKAQDVLARASRIIAPLQSSSGHTIYRARFGLFAEQEARDVCNRLTQRGQTCFAAVQTR